MSENKGGKTFGRVVVKFGGTSLDDGLKVSRAAESVAKKARQGVQVVVVVSAMGKSTDALIETANQACGGSMAKANLDDVVAMGERTSARVFSAALKAHGIRSHYLDPSRRDWPIVTNSEFGNADPVLPDCERLIKNNVQPLLEGGLVVVVPGFVGRTEDGRTTTMGRGGSDVTALVLARILHADLVLLVTDVEGILTADPKIIKEPRKLDEIAVDHLIGLADSGTKFIRKKALRYKTPEIDVKVVSSAPGDLDSDGTLIRGGFPQSLLVESHPEPVMAVTIVGKGISESPQTLSKIFGEVSKAGAHLLGMSVNHDSAILYLPMKTAGGLLEALHSVVVGDESAQAMAVKRDLAFVRVKGVGLEDTPGVVGSLTKALNSKAINIYGIFTIASSVVTFVDHKDEEKAVRLMKETLEKNHNGQRKTT